MSMQHSPAQGYLIEITEENLKKFVKLDLTDEEIEYFVSLTNQADDGFRPVPDYELEEREEGVKIRREFADKYGISPSIVFLSAEVEGCDGEAEPEKYFLFFDDNDKYEPKIVRKEWEDLPLEPVDSCWVNFG